MAAPSTPAFPPTLSSYPEIPGAGLTEILSSRIQIDPFNLVATVIFLLAIAHTFAAAKFSILPMSLRNDTRSDSGQPAGLPIAPATEIRMR